MRGKKASEQRAKYPLASNTRPTKVSSMEVTYPTTALERFGQRMVGMQALIPTMLGLAAAVCLISALIGYVALGSGNQHQLFRDIGPISLYSVLQTLAVAALGWLITKRESRHRDWRDLNNFWFLAGLGFFFLSIDGPIDLHGRVGKIIADQTGIEHPFGFHRFSDFIIATYMVTGLIVAAVHYQELVAYPRVLQYFFTAAVFVAAMVAIDGFATQTSTVWVVEETIKLFAGVFFVAAFTERYRIALRGEAKTQAVGVAQSHPYPA